MRGSGGPISDDDDDNDGDDDDSYDGWIVFVYDIVGLCLYKSTSIL